MTQLRSSRNLREPPEFRVDVVMGDFVYQLHNPVGAQTFGQTLS